MDIEDEDDIYAPDESVVPREHDVSDTRIIADHPVERQAGVMEDEEEGEEVEEDESDSVEFTRCVWPGVVADCSWLGYRYNH